MVCRLLGIPLVREGVFVTAIGMQWRNVTGRITLVHLGCRRITQQIVQTIGGILESL